MVTEREIAENLTEDGTRVIAAAILEIEPLRGNYASEDESGLVRLGCIAFLDPPKEGADIILPEKSLMVPVGGVIEGRRTFVNLLKYIGMTASSNLGSVFSVNGVQIFTTLLAATIDSEEFYRTVEHIEGMDSVSQAFGVRARLIRPVGPPLANRDNINFSK